MIAVHEEDYYKYAVSVGTSRKNIVIISSKKKKRMKR